MNSCSNCKYASEPKVANLYIDGTSDTYISCMYLVNGVKIRGSKKLTDVCEDFLEDKNCLCWFCGEKNCKGHTETELKHDDMEWD